MDLKKIFIKEACPTKMGGQAVMEGIMMKGEKKTALAVRVPGGNIEIETKKTKTYGKWMKIPLLRGVVAFVDSLVYGTKTLMDSANILEEYDDEEYEPGKFEAWFEKKFGSEALWKLLIGFSVVIALAFSIGVFILLPTWVASITKLVTTNVIWINLVEGLLRIALFIGYIWAVSFMPDMKRVLYWRIICEHPWEEICSRLNARYTPRGLQRSVRMLTASDDQGRWQRMLQQAL